MDSSTSEPFDDHIISSNAWLANHSSAEYLGYSDNLLYADHDRQGSTIEEEEKALDERIEEELNIKVHIKGNEIVFYHQNEAPHDDRKREALYTGKRRINNYEDISEESIGSTFKNNLNREPFVKEISSSERSPGLFCEIDGNVLNSLQGQGSPAARSIYKPPNTALLHQHLSSPITPSTLNYNPQPCSARLITTNSGSVPWSKMSIPDLGTSLQPWHKVPVGRSSSTSKVLANENDAVTSINPGHSVPSVNLYPASAKENNTVVVGHAGSAVNTSDIGNSITVTKVLPIVVQPVYNQNGHLTLSTQRLPPNQQNEEYCHAPLSYLTIQQKDFRRLLPNDHVRKEWHGKLCGAKERKHVKEVATAFENLRLHLPRLKRHKRMTTKLMILKEAISYIRSLYEALEINPDTRQSYHVTSDANSALAILSTSDEQSQLHTEEPYQSGRTDWNNNNNGMLPYADDVIVFSPDHSHYNGIGGVSATEDIIRAAYVEGCRLVQDKI